MIFSFQNLHHFLYHFESYPVKYFSIKISCWSYSSKKLTLFLIWTKSSLKLIVEITHYFAKWSMNEYGKTRPFAVTDEIALIAQRQYTCVYLSIAVFTDEKYEQSETSAVCCWYFTTPVVHWLWIDSSRESIMHSTNSQQTS